MLEHRSTNDLQRAIEAAHAERARAFKNAWSWLFRSTTDR